jgi:hypothetical protein
MGHLGGCLRVQTQVPRWGGNQRGALPLTSTVVGATSLMGWAVQVRPPRSWGGLEPPYA